MTVAYLSSAHEHGVRTSLKGLQNMDNLYLAGAKVFDNTHRGWVLQALRPGHIRSGICTVGADKGLDFANRALFGGFFGFYV
jgi:hypothetical protein